MGLLDKASAGRKLKDTTGPSALILDEAQKKKY
jgi:hypothetical protein